MCWLGLRGAKLQVEDAISALEIPEMGKQGGPGVDFRQDSSWVMCDNLISVRKSELTNYVGSLGQAKITELEDVLRAALGLR